MDDLLDEIDDDVDDESIAPDEEEVDSVGREEEQEDDDFDSLADSHDENEDINEDDDSSWKEEDEANLPADERIEGRRVDETGSARIRIPPIENRLYAVEAEPDVVDEEADGHRGFRPPPHGFGGDAPVVPSAFSRCDSDGGL